MDRIHWELAVLSKAIAYKNLSGASSQVGLSQPQLSRIIAKLEKSLGLILLDRSTKRNAAWTPQAFKIVEIYARNIRTLEQDLAKISESVIQKNIRIGALEGLIPTVVPVAKKLFDAGCSSIDIGIYDLNQLEEYFFRGDFDLLFVPREPGRKKFKFSKILGYQVLEKTLHAGTVKKTIIMSSFEFNTQKAHLKDQDLPLLISNSLTTRQLWQSQYGGEGVFPSAVLKQKPQKEKVEPVYLLGSDSFNSKLWDKI